MFYVKYNVAGNTDLPNVPRGTILFLVRGWVVILIGWGRWLQNEEMGMRLGWVFHVKHWGEILVVDEMSAGVSWGICQNAWLTKDCFTWNIGCGWVRGHIPICLSRVKRRTKPTLTPTKTSFWAQKFLGWQPISAPRFNPSIDRRNFSARDTESSQAHIRI